MQPNTRFAFILKMISKSSSLKKYNHSLPNVPLPSCSKFELFSDDYWVCYVKQLTLTMYHPVGTCRMGLGVQDSVVNSEMKVFGIKNLRVIDASIMPEIVSGNTNAPVIMIAEKGADLIKRDHNRQKILEKKNETKSKKDEL